MLFVGYPLFHPSNVGNTFIINLRSFFYVHQEENNISMGITFSDSDDNHESSVNSTLSLPPLSPSSSQPLPPPLSPSSSQPLPPPLSPSSSQPPPPPLENEYVMINGKMFLKEDVEKCKPEVKYEDCICMYY